MDGVKDLKVPIKRISERDSGFHYFFGYYDNPAFDGDDRFHLCNRVPFMDRIPKAGETCELGMIDLDQGAYSAIAETGAWNFQQGAMLQWVPDGGSGAVLYNDFDGKDYRTIIRNPGTGESRTIGWPVANVSPDGRYGLSVNFNRIYDFRPGYGYCNTRDRWLDDPMPEDDGIRLADLRTGESRLIVGYKRLGAMYNLSPEIRDRKIVINHITFNRTSDRFLFLVRYFPSKGEGWKTGLGTSDLEGNVYLLRPYTYASHYHWKDGKRILIHADAGEGPALYELEDLSQGYRIYDRAFFRKDIHCSYSPDRRFIIGDGYPDAEGFRGTQLYDINSGKGMLLGRFLSSPASTGDFRCDLHTRWSRSGKTVSFDSTHEGFRGIYTMDLSGVLSTPTAWPA
jgi:hypothetical protein